MFKLELTPQQLNVIGAALGKAPYEMAAPVVAELQKQVDAQQPAKASLMPSVGEAA